MTEREHTRSESESESGVSRPELAADLVVYRDRPAELTLYPADATDVERVSNWITAEEGAFVSLEAVR